MKQRLRRWLISVMIDALHCEFNWTVSEIGSVRAAVDSIVIPRYETQLQGIHERLLYLEGEIHVGFENLKADTPRLSFGTLAAWEAIAYAAQKWDRDEEAHAKLDRMTEVLHWANIYLTENQWPVPPRDVLEMLLSMRDRLKEKQLV